MKVNVDKIASSARHAKLSHEVVLSDEIVSKEGFVIAGRVLNEKTSYNTMELSSGRMSKVCKGDVIVGVLGARHALKGFSGVVPQALAVGDTIQILNLGGVLGLCTSSNVELGAPLNIEVLGAVLHFPSFEHRIGAPANVLCGTVIPYAQLPRSAPLMIVTGTCMNAGKTRAACEVIKHLTRAGKKVAAAKLSGISLMRDTLEMSDYGASSVCNFTDAGVVCSSPENVVAAAKGIVTYLTATKADCIVLEFGDGIMGEYGVMNLLCDEELMSYVAFHILCANDPVGAWGARQFLEGRCPTIDVVSGPATDNDVGKRFIEGKLGLTALNAIAQGEALGLAAIEALRGMNEAPQVPVLPLASSRHLRRVGGAVQYGT